MPVNSPFPTPAPTEAPLLEHFGWPSNIVTIPTPTPWIDLKEFTSIPNIIYEHMPMSVVPYFVFGIIILVMVVVGLAVVVANTHSHLAQMQIQLEAQTMKTANIEQLFMTAMLQLENKLEPKLEALSVKEKQIDNVQKLVSNITASLEVEHCLATNYNATFNATSKEIDLLNDQMDIVVKTLAALANDSINKK
ncbi:hypothetical protein COEREDRAFT_12717 [Coemansia reversa NRRL 1564]|uniref:Uncharacterized protein n=1 Tax=Coemansia reversa (strain ATCC 12441 / NRRL 1564) TaxID=763665 RepID=A0A2G5B0E0_COERN|nr:hypothetical protein COEREDRAFT_12717 [Coemansia reversa NRRL 1564]|eukprot:PIA12496.1 hypothetical protein COEREDRAFT_12717 [Coemansia reversa NRRL 1564]